MRLARRPAVRRVVTPNQQTAGAIRQPVAIAQVAVDLDDATLAATVNRADLMVETVDL